MFRIYKEERRHMANRKSCIEKRQIGLNVPTEILSNIDEITNRVGMSRAAFIRIAIEEKLIGGSNNPLCNQVIINMVESVRAIKDKISPEEYRQLMEGLDQITIARGRR